MRPKHIFVTGGVVSGLGKGITASSLGLLLKSRGYSVTLQKLDLYLNVDLRQMSPYQHGEVFVTADGRETDLDIGHYERFIDEDMSKSANITSGQVYASVIKKEREGVYNGETVQLIPHLTNEIMANIYAAGGPDTDFIITEIGGTVGDIEGLPFIEAIRQVSIEKGKENVLYIHVTLIPSIGSSGELKTKPTQHSVKELLSYGIQPDIIVCRSNKPMDDEIKSKIALFCNLKQEYVIENRDVESIYEIPLLLEEERLAEYVLQKLHMENHSPHLEDWKEFVDKRHKVTHDVTVGLVGDYVELHDAYLSTMEALHISGLDLHANVNIKWISSKEVASLTKEEATNVFRGLDGLLLVGDLKEANKEGYFKAIRYAKKEEIPFLATCYAYQMVAEEAVGKEIIKKTSRGREDDIRMGAFPVQVKEDSLVHALYGKANIKERFWHTYEIEPTLYPKLEESGYKLVGFSDEYVEIIEKTDHPFFIAAQFQPAFIARPNTPHPLFQGFVTAMCTYQQKSDIKE